METILFALPGNEKLTASLANLTGAAIGKAEIRRFPDGESYIRIESQVTGKKVVLVCTLNAPDDKLLPLYFMSKTLMELGANSVRIVAPYLAYMRQDKQFHPGEAVTSTYFASLISQFATSLITIDPHLHRRKNLSEIYSIPTTVAHAANHISDWIRKNIDRPLLIGPDSESKQWVSEVAKDADASYIILEKTRLGDREVKISIPEVDEYQLHTPVLVDDIISTARTMIETVKHLTKAGLRPPVCIGVHAVFAGNAYEELKNAGIAQVITCNTIEHESNGIDITDLIAGN